MYTVSVATTSGVEEEIYFMKRVNPAYTTPEERRAALVRTQRETIRVVRRTLMTIALLGGGYYLWLLSREKKQQNAQNERPEE